MPCGRWPGETATERNAKPTAHSLDVPSRRRSPTHGNDGTRTLASGPGQPDDREYLNGRLSQCWRGALEPDARKLVHAHHFDQRTDMRLRATDTQRAPADAEATREHGQVQHQRGVG